MAISLATNAVQRQRYSSLRLRVIHALIVFICTLPCIRTYISRTAALDMFSFAWIVCLNAMVPQTISSDAIGMARRTRSHATQKRWLTIYLNHFQVRHNQFTPFAAPS